MPKDSLRMMQEKYGENPWGNMEVPLTWAVCLMKGLTKTQLCRETGISPGATALWDRGVHVPSKKTWAKISDGTGKSYSEMLDRIAMWQAARSPELQGHSTAQTSSSDDLDPITGKPIDEMKFSDYEVAGQYTVPLKPITDLEFKAAHDAAYDRIKQGARFLGAPMSVSEAVEIGVLPAPEPAGAIATGEPETDAVSRMKPDVGQATFPGAHAEEMQTTGTFHAPEPEPDDAWDTF